MEREKVYSQSLGIKKLDSLYGRWIKQGNVFIEQSEDLWHQGTEYYVADGSNDKVIKGRIAQLLLEADSASYINKMKNIRSSIIYVPVAPVANGGYCLYADKEGRYDEISRIFTDHDMAKGLSFDHLNWVRVDTEHINEFAKKNKILPTNKPYMDFNEHLQYLGRTEEQSLKVYFVPIVKIMINIASKEYMWYGIGDSQTSLFQGNREIKPSKLLTKGYPECPIRGADLLKIIFGVVAVYAVIGFRAHQNDFGFLVAMVISAIVLLVAYIVLRILLTWLLNFLAECTFGVVWNLYHDLKIKHILSSRKKALRGKGFEIS